MKIRASEGKVTPCSKEQRKWKEKNQKCSIKMKVNLILGFSICIWFAFCQEKNKTTQDLTDEESFATELVTFNSFKLIEAFNRRFPQNKIAKPSSDQQFEFANLAISHKMAPLDEDTFINTFSSKNPDLLKGLFEGLAKNLYEVKRNEFIKCICTRFNEDVGYEGTKTIRFKLEDAHKVAVMIEEAIKSICSINPKFFNSKVDQELKEIFENESAITFPNSTVSPSSDTWWSLKNNLDWTKMSLGYIVQNTSLMNPLEKTIYKFENVEKSQKNLNDVKKMIIYSLKNGSRTGDEVDIEEIDSYSYSNFSDKMGNLKNTPNSNRKLNENNSYMSKNDEIFHKDPPTTNYLSLQEKDWLKKTTKDPDSNQTNSKTSSNGIPSWYLWTIGIIIAVVFVITAILIKKNYWSKNRKIYFN